MLVKRNSDHNLVHTATCGELREILRCGEYPHFDLAIALNIKANQGHYHRLTEEIYFIMDGKLTLALLKPREQTPLRIQLEANELVIIKPGTHHRILDASEPNRLCVLSVPSWSAEDEFLSQQL